MNIFLAQQNYLIGDFEGNSHKIIQGIRDAKAKGADLLVFSELAICGYPPRDFLYFRDFIRRCEEALQRIAAEAQGIAVLVGRNPSLIALTCWQPEFVPMWA